MSVRLPAFSLLLLVTPLPGSATTLSPLRSDPDADMTVHDAAGKGTDRETGAAFADEEGEISGLPAALFPDFGSAEVIKVPAGFVPACGLTRFLPAARRQAGSSGSVAYLRENVRSTLENLREDVPALVRTYRSPFRPCQSVDPGTRAAPGADDSTFGRYGADYVI